MITLDNQGQFVTTEGKRLGVYALKNNGRWQFRAEGGVLYGSGVSPAQFVKDFWLREDITDKVLDQ